MEHLKENKTIWTYRIHIVTNGGDKFLFVGKGEDSLSARKMATKYRDLLKLDIRNEMGEITSRKTSL